jgi:hypothetical protein
MTKFEKGILNWVAENSADTALKEQCHLAHISSREKTGVGCYSEIEIMGLAPVTEKEYGARGPLDGPAFNASNLKHGGGVLVWFKNGFIKTIEVYTYDDVFPKDHDELGEVNYLDKNL